MEAHTGRHITQVCKPKSASSWMVPYVPVCAHLRIVATQAAHLLPCPRAAAIKLITAASPLVRAASPHCAATRDMRGRGVGGGREGKEELEPPRKEELEMAKMKALPGAAMTMPVPSS